MPNAGLLKTVYRDIVRELPMVLITFEEGKNVDMFLDFSTMQLSATAVQLQTLINFSMKSRVSSAAQEFV